MLNALCFLYGKLQKDEVIVIRMTDDFECVVSRKDKVQKKGSAFIVFRDNGRISVINPSQVINARTMTREDWLL